MQKWAEQGIGNYDFKTIKEIPIIPRDLLEAIEEELMLPSEQAEKQIDLKFFII